MTKGNTSRFRSPALPLVPDPRQSHVHRSVTNKKQLTNLFRRDTFLSHINDGVIADLIQHFREVTNHCLHGVSPVSRRQQVELRQEISDNGCDITRV